MYKNNIQIVSFKRKLYITVLFIFCQLNHPHQTSQIRMFHLCVCLPLSFFLSLPLSLFVSLYARVSLGLFQLSSENAAYNDYSHNMRDLRDPKWTVLFIRPYVLYFYDPDVPPKLYMLGARENALSQDSLQHCQYLLFLADCSFYSHTVITYSQLTAFKGGFP